VLCDPGQVNLIHAYHEPLSQITKTSPSLDECLKLHRETSTRIKAAVTELGLSQIPARLEIAANGVTAVSITACQFVSGPLDESRVSLL
jgi:aspartate aminotransferase-like enzyme